MFICPFYCPYINQFNDNDEDYRSPDGFQPPGFQGPGFGPSFGPGFGGPQGDFPPGPPPSIAPQFTQAEGVGVFAVDPGAISRCLYRFTYIRLNNGRRFWAWLTFVGRNSAAGYRWTGRRWVYFGIDLRRIDNFICL